MTSIHGENITTNLIMIAFANGKGSDASGIDLQSFALIEPLNVVCMRVGRSLQIELLHYAKSSYIGTTRSFND